MLDGAGGFGTDVHIHLFGFEAIEHFAFPHLVAVGDIPLFDAAFGHGHTDLEQSDFNRHDALPLREPALVAHDRDGRVGRAGQVARQVADMGGDRVFFVPTRGSREATGANLEKIRFKFAEKYEIFILIFDGASYCVIDLSRPLDAEGRDA